VHPVAPATNQEPFALVPGKSKRMYSGQTGDRKSVELDVEVALAVQAEWENHTGKTKENETGFHGHKIVVEVVLLFEKNKSRVEAFRPSPGALLCSITLKNKGTQVSKPMLQR
jgi:hypothetical protein